MVRRLGRCLRHVREKGRAGFNIINNSFISMIAVFRKITGTCKEDPKKVRELLGLVVRML